MRGSAVLNFETVKQNILDELYQQHFPFTAYCLDVIELPYGQFEFKLICMVSPL